MFNLNQCNNFNLKCIDYFDVKVVISNTTNTPLHHTQDEKKKSVYLSNIHKFFI